MKARCLAVVLVLACAFHIFATESAAQELSISGTVRDASGVIPGASVILSSGGNELATAMTDGVGVYRFERLAPAGYELSFVMAGYETVIRNVTVGPNTGPVDVVLAVGRVSTTLTVTATAGKATATRLPVPDDDVPVQVSSIPQELLHQQAVNTVEDALKNASGVRAFRWYGVYEQYAIRGFLDPNRDDFNVYLLDGMRMAGNRYATQTNNIQSIEVLKGPSSIVYGRGAVGGAINIVRKKPEAIRAYEFGYRGGRFNTHQVLGAATGPVGSNNRLLYRLDSSFEHSDGWRKAGADRLNISPSLTWIMGENARLTVHQTFNRDHFDGDSTVPFEIVGHPSYTPEIRFDLPQDRVRIDDSKTHFLFNGNLSSNWEFRNAFLIQRTSDDYFVTEYVYSEDDLVYREPLDFHYHRTPLQNQSELVGRLDGFGRHNLLFGYEYQDDNYRYDTSAGNDPGCFCGYWPTIEPIDVRTLVETQRPLDIETVARQLYYTDRIHALYWQDQIDVVPQLKFNFGGRYEDYRNVREADYLLLPSRNNTRERSHKAYTYRAGFVYAPLYDHQLYFNTSSSFTPVDFVTEDGTELDPSTGRGYEVGHRWQGWDGRVDTSLALYYITKNNLNVRESATTYTQIGEQTSRGFDLDVNTDLGGRAHLILNYGFTRPRYEDADSLTGKMPRYTPKHTVNAWLRKDWAMGLNVSLGARYLGPQFFNGSNTLRVGGYTIVSGAVGYRAEQWEWTLNAENLFDRQHYLLPGNYTGMVLPGQPINVTTGIRLRFN